MAPDFAATLLAQVDRYREPLLAFLRELVAIPSPSGQEEAVIRRIQAEMTAVGFDEVKIDPLGNILGRIGTGPRSLAFDAHVDTVAVTDPDQWSCDPFAGKFEAGQVYGRGAVDQKAGMAALVYAGKAIKELNLGTGLQIWMVGSVMEEDCDGLCWHYLLQEGLLEPELVVSTEPTGLTVARGQRGRLEMRVAATGKSSHGSMPELGENAIYKIVHELFLQAGLIVKMEYHSKAHVKRGKVRTRYRLRPHSIRKYFRTQLGSQGIIPTDYIEYMMGHSISTYNDIRMKGVDFLQNKYAMTELSIRQKEKADIYDFVEDILRSKGYGIDKELLRRAIAKPHRTVCSPVNYEEERRTAIRDGFMEMLRKELLDPSLEQEIREQSLSGY